MVGALLQSAARMVRRIGGGLLALLILFEEWGWDPLQRALARLGRLPLLRQAESAIARLPPQAALVVFMVPVLLLLPVKLLALGLIAQGRQWLGIAVIVAAKLLGTAVVARLFALTRPALLQMPWFARAHGRWAAWKGVLLTQVRVSWVWRQARVLRRQARHMVARWFGR